jgi:hypothetical protein
VLFRHPQGDANGRERSQPSRWERRDATPQVYPDSEVGAAQPGEPSGRERSRVCETRPRRAPVAMQNQSPIPISKNQSFHNSATISQRDISVNYKNTYLSWNLYFCVFELSELAYQAEKIYYPTKGIPPTDPGVFARKPKRRSKHRKGH